MNVFRMNPREVVLRKNPTDLVIIAGTSLLAAVGTAFAVTRKRVKKTLFGSTPPKWGGYYMGGAHRGREFGNWQSDNAWDIFGPAGTPVHSLTAGKVKMANLGVPPGPSSKVYGDQVWISSAGGQPDMFYTHIKVSVKKGQVVQVGDLIGNIVAHETNPSMPIHVHLGIDQKKHIKDFVSEDGTLLARDVKVE